MRNHQPIELTEINGLWRRGSNFSTPRDHQSVLENFTFVDDGIKTRPGVGGYQDLANPLGNVLRQYTYVLPTGPTLLVLIEGGDIYHVINPTTIHGPILSIPDMTDFGFVDFNDRAYINPFYQNANGQMVGVQNEFLYVYIGNGSAARKASGDRPTNAGKLPFVASNNSIGGVVTAGVHFFAVSFITGGTPDGLGPEVFPIVIAPGAKTVGLDNIPIGGVGVTGRLVAMTKAIAPESFTYNPASQTWYEAFTLNNNTDSYQLLNIDDANLTNDVTALFGAADPPVSDALLAAPSNTNGYADRGFRLIGVVYETDTGYLTAPGPEFFAGVSTVNLTKGLDISNIPVSPDSFVTKRHLIATKTIGNYNNDQNGYQFFFIPDGTISDNVTTTKTVSFFDSDLFDDASYLIDNFSEIPAGSILSTYHQRLVSIADYDNMSVARISDVGEPESINGVTGLIQVTRDGTELTNAQEFRDVLYLFKLHRTYAYNDNGDVPSSWQEIILDRGTGTHNFGIAKVLDSEGVNLDYLLIADVSGIFIFNGAYSRPELTYKIKDLWVAIDRDNFRLIVCLNDSINQRLYVVLDDGTILYGDYSKGLTPKTIRWAVWRYDFVVRSIALLNTDTLVIGAYDEVAP